MVKKNANPTISKAEFEEDTEAIPAPPTPKRKRLNLDLSPEAYDLLQKLVNESGKSMTDVLRTGLALYGIAWEERKKNRSLGIIEDDKVVKELVIP